jgi:ubiquinone/menaquinone biosynthesis C-methylase UbiE
MVQRRNMDEVEIDLVELQKMARVNRRVINRLKERVSILETALELVCDDPQMAWLYRNRSERMDATVPLFPSARAEFHLARYRFAASRVAGRTVADIACGTGYGVRLMKEQGEASRVTGIDCCPQAVDYARSRHAAADCSFKVADAANTGLPGGSVDVVTSFETIEHVLDDKALLAEFARILKPDGMLICSTPNGWPLEIAPHHRRVYDRASFCHVLQSGFRVDELFNQNSGTDFAWNHNQPAGIVPTTDQNHQLAECFIAVASRQSD